MAVRQPGFLQGPLRRWLGGDLDPPARMVRSRPPARLSTVRGAAVLYFLDDRDPPMMFEPLKICAHRGRERGQG
jgi:hypothetical protein